MQATSHAEVDPGNLVDLIAGATPEQRTALTKAQRAHRKSATPEALRDPAWAAVVRAVFDIEPEPEPLTGEEPF